jgi:1-acyl-sn-glycerol-3-phosphate acyltransferase
MRSLVATLKISAFFLLCLVVIPAQLLVLAVSKGPSSYIIPQLWHKGVCLIFGIKVHVSGVPARQGQTLYVSNHLSYLDIPAIATVLRASFVAKKDVASWPVFGFLSKLQQTAFIERSRGAAAKEANALDTMLEQGKSLVIFPEGTSTDGQSVLPFKSSLFSLALKDSMHTLQIQPFSIHVKSVNELEPNTQELRDVYAWHRDMDTELPTHLWLFAKSKGAEIELTFHPVVASSQFKDRKTLAKYCFETVSNGIEQQRSLAA